MCPNFGTPKNNFPFENLLFLGVPILKYITMYLLFCREGSVVLSFYVWSSEHPHQMLIDKIEMEFKNDMRNIRIGDIYEDPGTNVELFNSLLKL